MAGTAHTSALTAAGWKSESSFGEALSTIDYRMQIREPVDVSGLGRALVNRGGSFQYLAEGDADVPGVFSGTITTVHDLAGHGTTTAGALTITNLIRLLGHVFGNSDVTQVGGVEAGTGSATNLNVDGGSELFLDGGLVRVGAVGDGRGGGQAVAIDTRTGAAPTTAATLLTAMSAAANDGDVVYAMGLVYPDSTSRIPSSSGATSNNTLRWVISGENLQFVCRGCFPQSAVITGLEPGGLPRISTTWYVASVVPVSVTFPSATDTADYVPAVTTTGSLFVEDKGTTTRTTDVVREFSVEIDLGTTPVLGDGGLIAGQNIVGYRRGPMTVGVSLAVEAEATTATPTWWDYHVTDPNSITFKHILRTLNTDDGSALAMYFPNCKPVAIVPSQVDVDGMNYVRAQFQALTATSPDAGTTNELSRACFVLGMG